MDLKNPEIQEKLHNLTKKMIGLAYELDNLRVTVCEAQLAVENFNFYMKKEKKEDGKQEV